MPADMPIQAKMVSKAVENAQRKVEEINFSMRKNVLDYDDVMNKQRQVIYEERNKILDGKDLTEHISDVTHDTVEREVSQYCADASAPDDWDLAGLRKWMGELTGRSDLPALSDDDDVEQIDEMVDDFVDTCFSDKQARLGAPIMDELSAQVMLRVIDTRWMNYLQEMDYLKTGIGLRGFGQRDPLVEYKTEAYAAFTELVNTMYEDFLRTILRIELAQAPKAEAPSALSGARFSGPADVDGDQGANSTLRSQPGPARPPERVATAAPKASAAKPSTYRKADDPDPYVGVGRNDPCPCGSGKKFKNCHGRNR
jgi:preprotein translocase subunit SecA